MRLLLVEDEKELARALVTVLTYNHYSVDEVYDGEQAVVYLENGNYDGVILDIMLPKLDGISVLKKIRAQGNQVPVLILSARSALEDKVNGLDCGADDYLTKPFGVMELISRVKALLRRSKSIQEDQILRLKNVTLDSEKRIVHVNDIPCELTFKEFELLKLLMINAGIVLRREVIMMDVWGTDYEGESRTLDMHIKTLRQKLGDAGNMIKTVRNVGYKME